MDYWMCTRCKNIVIRDEHCACEWHDPGAKHDQGKVPIHSVLRYFPRALEAVARVNEHGASKHGWDTWHTIDDPMRRYSDAELRHEIARCKGEDIDPESGLLHLAHRAWGLLALLELTLRGQDETRGIDLLPVQESDRSEVEDFDC